MLSIVLRLAVITLLLYAGVTYWYGRVEERLQEPAPAEKKEQAADPEQAAGKPGPPVDNDYGIILTRNIFQAGGGSGDNSGGQPQVNLDDLAETKLHLALLGTVTGSKNDARAIIRDEKTKLEDLYQTGSEVQGAVISRISRGKVVLQVNGREEVLTIKEPETENQGRQGIPQARSRVVEKPPTEASAKAVENKVPEAQPRRRISFRNAAPPPQAPEVENPAKPAPEEGQPETADMPPLPNDEAPPLDSGQEKAAEQQGQ